MGRAMREAGAALKKHGGVEVCIFRRTYVTLVEIYRRRT